MDFFKEKIMFKLSPVLIALLWFSSLTGFSASANELTVVGNATMKGIVYVGNTRLETSGRSSFFVKATAEELKQGVIRLGGFSMAFFNVPQEPLSDKPVSLKSGVLGFAQDPSASKIYLKYDNIRGIIYGEIQGFVDAAYMADLGQRIPDARDDFTATPKQQAVMSVEIKMEKPLNFNFSTDQVLKSSGNITAKARVLPDSKFGGKEMTWDLNPVLVDINIAQLFLFEAAKKLCVQPVRIGKFNISGFPPIFIPQYTGDGLAFGLPGANTQWAKADVIFTVRDWMTVWNSSYWTLTDAENAGLRATVSADDCVEVFFVDQLSPVSMWGGGATWGSGTAGAKVISSDGNADGGIDLTHLGHELGHVLGLPHPTGLPGVSTNTLMCPSGWMNDNPKRNSQENKDNVSNPLLTFAIKLKTAGPDCNSSADCGACP